MATPLMTTNFSSLELQSPAIYVFTDSADPLWSTVRQSHASPNEALRLERAFYKARPGLGLHKTLSLPDSELVQDLLFLSLYLKNATVVISRNEFRQDAFVITEHLMECSETLQQQDSESLSTELVALTSEFLEVSKLRADELRAALRLQERAFQLGNPAAGYFAAQTCFRLKSRIGSVESLDLDNHIQNLLKTSAQQGVTRAYIDLAILAQRSGDLDRSTGFWQQFFLELSTAPESFPEAEMQYLISSIHSELYVNGASTEKIKGLHGQKNLLDLAKKFRAADLAFHDWLKSQTWSEKDAKLDAYALPAAAGFGWLLMLSIGPNFWVWLATGAAGAIFFAKRLKIF